MASERKTRWLNYDAPRTFVPGAPLRDYLEEKDPEGGYEEGRVTSLLEVVCSMKNIIKNEKLFDEKNPKVVICDSDMEKALDRPGFGRFELSEIICSQMTMLPEKEPKKKRVGEEITCTSRKFGLIKGSSRFKIKRKFRAMLKTLPEFKKKQKTFAYGELCNFTSAYIHKNKKTLIDERHIPMCFCKNDLMGRAFKVNAFHRDQVSSMIRSQLVAISPKIIL